ncbi:hypothetical protein EG327_006239 [Venturia inaequalis]|uniref:Uncharacterized protein n=1 Tax=Venturia inaequalis TaxID=5025 RepID=A0A8H3Z6G9_VENIN|nr:hypothetical protein EG327_006239 [Venturia inaequalis]
MLPFTLSFLLASLAAATSDVSTFSDSACKNSYRAFSGPNGYPNGTCSRLDRSGNFSSFQVVGLDTGCMVTIYEKDTTSDVCSGFPILAELATCYNTTYVYYSIDFCTTPGSSSSVSSSSSATTSSGAVATTSSAPTSSQNTNTGAIAGGIVGGVVSVAAIVLGVFLYMRRKKRNHAIELGDHPATTGDEKRIHEMDGVNTQELPAGQGAGGEILELSATEGGRDGDHGYNAITKAHNLHQAPVELPAHEYNTDIAHGEQR